MSDAGAGQTDHARSLRDAGIAAYCRREFAAAIPPLEELLRAQPRDVEARSVLGMAYCQLQRHGDAIRTLGEVLQVQPGNVDARLHLGISLAHSGRPDEARLQFNEVLRLQPGNTDARTWIESLNVSGAARQPLYQPAPPPKKMSGWGWLGLGRIGILVLVFLAVCCVSVVQGFQGFVEAQKFHQPQEMSYEEFVKKRPHEGWFRISHARLLVPSGVFQMKVRKGEKSGPVTSLCAPLASEEDPTRDEKHFVFVETEDPEIVATADEIRQLDERNQASEADAYVDKNLEKVFLKRTVEGVVQTGFKQTSLANAEELRTDPDTAPDFVVLAEGTRPDSSLSLLAMAGGTLGILIVLVPFGFWLRAQMRR